LGACERARLGIRARVKARRRCAGCWRWIMGCLRSGLGCYVGAPLAPDSEANRRIVEVRGTVLRQGYTRKHSEHEIK